jgi:hypothetical protein
MAFSITVDARQFNQGKFTVNDLSGNSTVEELKEKVADELSIAHNVPHLSFRGKQLIETKTLADYAIQDNSVVQIVGKRFSSNGSRSYFSNGLAGNSARKREFENAARKWHEEHPGLMGAPQGAGRRSTRKRSTRKRSTCKRSTRRCY